jgi:hypothetical protein
MPEWQPIETAPPFTEQPVLVYDPEEGMTTAIHDRGWEVYPANELPLAVEPTHWMPLPDPPEER